MPNATDMKPQKKAARQMIRFSPGLETTAAEVDERRQRQGFGGEPLPSVAHDFEAWNPSEMRNVVGHDGQAVAKRGRRDPDIVVTDRLAELVQVATDS